jgi:hypothetical protein
VTKRRHCSDNATPPQQRADEYANDRSGARPRRRYATKHLVRLLEIMVTGLLYEHAQHALDDFCREVYGAWEAYKKRLQKAVATCPSMD